MKKVSHMAKLPMAVATVTGMLITFVTGVVAQTIPPNLPAAVICYVETDQSWRIGYLYKINKNGEAMYITPDGKLVTTVDANGVVGTPTNRPAALDCYGKTLDELRSNGRTMEFQRTK